MHYYEHFSFVKDIQMILATVLDLGDQFTGEKF